MLERYCDALVIGTDIPGLITAAFLARRGLTVKVLDLNLYQDHPHLPDPRVISCLHSKYLRSIIGRLNVSESTIYKFNNRNQPLQILFQKHRLDICSQVAEFYQELRREFGGDFDKIKSFYDHLAQLKHTVSFRELIHDLLVQGFFNRRKATINQRKHNLDDQFKNFDSYFDPKVKAFIRAQQSLLLGQQNDQPFLYQLAELLNPNDGEVLSVMAGQNEFVEILADRIEHHEGGFRRKVSLEKLLYSGGIFEGAKIAQAQSKLLARYVVWNTNLDGLPHFLPKAFRFGRLKKAILNRKKKAHWFGFEIQLDNQLVPEPLQENSLFVVDEKKPLLDSNFFYVQKKVLGAKASLKINYLMAPEGLEKDNDFFQTIHEKILDNLGDFFPFAREHFKIVFPLKKQPEDADEPTLFPLKEDDFAIFKHVARQNPIFAKKARHFIDLFPISYQTPAPNFFLTSQEIMASLGFEAQVHLGLLVTDQIWEDVEKAKKKAMKAGRRMP